MRRLCALVSILILCLAEAGHSEPYPAPVDLHINDFADLIDPGTEAGIRTALSALLAETGIEMTVVTIKTRQDYEPPVSLEAFALGLFNEWGVGHADRNDGILLLVVEAERETRIQTGAAYGQGYDVTAQDIVSNAMVPEFRAGNYAVGIERGVIETIDRVALRLAEKDPIDMRPVAAPGLFERLDGWLFGLVFIAVAVYGIFGRRIGDGLTRIRRCPGCGRRGLHSHRGIRVAKDGGGLPWEHHSITCRHCDFRDEREPSPVKSRSARTGGGGRRGGFGGGRSSGGGASGRW